MLPTWIVIKSHVPIEHGEDAAISTTKGDEEEAVQSASAIDKSKAVTTHAAVTK